MKLLFSKRYIRSRFLLLIVSIIVGISSGNVIWVYFLQWPFLTPTRILLFCVICFAAIIACYLLLSWLNKINTLSGHARILSFIFGVAFALLLFFSLRINLLPNVLLTPVSDLKLSLLSEKNPLSAGRQVTLQYLSTEMAEITYGSEVSFDQFDLENGWERTGSVLISNGQAGNLTSWSGRVGRYAELTFQTGPQSGVLMIDWNGLAQTVDLFAVQPGFVTVKAHFRKTWSDNWVGGITAWVLLAFAIFVLLQSLSGIPGKKSVKPEQGAIWLVYAIPPLVAWLLFLLAFWPGLMSQDSIDQWGQMLRMQIESWHSPFHTLTIWLLTRLWLAPAAVLLSQIAILALAIAWGLQQLVDMGLPRWAAALLSCIFAISPVNGVMLVTLWKDIPYSIGLFILTVQVVKIVFSRGKWLDQRVNWIGLWFSTMLVGLYRHNGIAVGAVVFLVLLMVYRSSWRRLSLAGGLWIAGILLVLGPLYNQVGVDRQKGYSNVAFLYQIGAHYQSGSRFTAKEQAYLNNLLPVEEWRERYDPCTVNPILFNEQFNLQNFLYDDTRTPRRLFFDLMLRNPLINLKHFFTSGSLVWEINPSCYLYYSPLDYYETAQPPYEQVKWVMKNSHGLQEDSKSPALADFLFDLYYKSKESWLLWRPAVYLYWVLFVVVALALRFRSWRYLLFAMPVVVQSGILMVVNIAQDFRYQFGMVLVGILFLGLPFIMGAETDHREIPK